MLRRALTFSAAFFRTIVSHPSSVAYAAKMMVPLAQGLSFAGSDRRTNTLPPDPASSESNALLRYFDSVREGPGIFKWRHYFEIYHRHFQRFIGRDVRVMEVGVYSGGSLPMWREYFGPGSQIYGVDIEKACEIYKAERIEILIGDQSDRTFWAKVREKVPRLDILIDDGGHHPLHQVITLEEMLPHLNAGGVYVCEDIHGIPNYFGAFVSGIALGMNGGRPSRLETTIHSIHSYPMITVIEKRASELSLLSERHGTEWQPFLDPN